MFINSTVRPCGQMNKCPLMSLMNCSFLVFIPLTILDPQVGQLQPGAHMLGTTAADYQVNTSLFGHLHKYVFHKPVPAFRVLTNGLCHGVLFFPKVIMWQLIKRGHGSSYLWTAYLEWMAAEPFHPHTGEGLPKVSVEIRIN